MIEKILHATRQDGIKLYYIYSTNNKKIMQSKTCRIYNDAIDIETSNYEYIETDIPIIEEEV